MVSAYVFAIVATMMLANGGVLAVITRDLPVSLRPAANTWQVGTFLIAIGCGLFAVASDRPHPFLLVTVNTAFLFGLLIYGNALARFYDRTLSPLHCLPILAGIGIIFWFSVVDENFKVRILGISIAWCWLMLASIEILARQSRHDDSASRTVLLVIFIVMVGFTALRGVAFVANPLPADFSVTNSSSNVNLVTPIFMAVLPVLGTTSFILMCSDRIRLQWERAASTDYLTGLPNRRTLARHAEKLFSAASRLCSPLTVAIFDIDDFKRINDTYGHDVGDQALQHIADILSAGAGTGTMVARTGGEEFVMLFDTCPDDRIEELRKAVAATPFKIDRASIPITVSVGVATCSVEDREFSDLLRRADRALYTAKSGGRNRVETSGIMAASV